MSTPGEAQPQYFPQTSWTLLLRARQGSDEASAALAEFSRRYYRPVYAYLSAMIRDRDQVEELVQGFFTTVILSGRLLAQVDRAKGSFRPYLKQALRNYVIDEQRKQARQKRRSPDEQLRPDGWSKGWEHFDQAASPSPDEAFHTAWVQALLEEALVRIRQLCEEKGQTTHLALFLGRYLSASPEPPSWKELGMAYGVDEKTARHRAETVARHFRLVLREMLIQEVGSELAADEEIATLLAFL